LRVSYGWSGCDKSTYALSVPFEIDLAGRIVVGLLLVTMLFAFTYFATTFGRSRWFGLAAVPVAVQWTFTEGFLDYYLGVSLLLVALAVQHRYLVQPTRRKGIGLAVLGLLVFFAHVQALLFYAVGTVLLLGLHLLYRPTMRASFKRLAAHLLYIGGPIIGVTAIWLIGQQASLEGALTSGPTEWIAADKKASELFTRGLFVFLAPQHGTLLFATILGLGASALGLRVWRFMAPAAFDAEAHTIEDGASEDRQAAQHISGLFPALFLVVSFLAFVLGPLNMGHYWNFHSRILTLVYYLAVIALIPALKPRREWIAVLAALPLVVVVGYARETWSASLAMWDEYADGFKEVLSHAPRGGHLLFVPESSDRAGFTSQVWRHLGQYQTAFNDGTTTFSFGFQPGRLIRERNPKLILEFANVEKVSHMADYGCFDVILQKGPTHIETLYPEAVRLVRRRGSWSLYAPIDMSCKAGSVP